MSIKRILLTGGRAPSALYLARLFHEDGYEIYMADSIPYTLSSFSNIVKQFFLIASPVTHPNKFKSDLTSIIEREKIDLLLPTCEEVFHISKEHAYFSSLCDLFCEPIDTLNTLHNKWTFINYLKKENKNVPKTYLLTSKKQAEIEKKNFDSFVLKPVYSRFSSHVHIIHDRQIPAISPSHSHPWVMQEWIEGTQYCAYAICQKGTVYAFSLYETIFSAGIGATIHFQHHENTSIEQWVHTFVQNLEFTGQIAFDFIVKENGEIYPIECNPRLTSGIHLFTKNDSISRAFFDTPSLIYPNINQKTMLSSAMLLYGVRQFSLNWLVSFFTSKDVLFSFKDLKPFFFQPFSLISLWKIAKKQKISLLEASTIDIEWDGST